jgi:O-antigen/teichoic acid export membrane protein
MHVPTDKTPSRLGRWVSGLASGYAAIAATALYSIASVPIALRYLSIEEFGIWSIVIQLVGYITLVDIGISNSLARLLIDHKDNCAKSDYASLIRTAALAFIGLGAIVTSASYLLAPALTSIAAIPAEYRHVFSSLVRFYGFVTGMGFCTRLYQQVLCAHQRMDLVNYTQIAQLLASIAALWFSFQASAGLYSLIWVGLCGTAIQWICSYFACRYLRLLPRTHGTWSWTHFRSMAAYGKDVFLVAVGSQLIIASQTVVLSRTLGLSAAAGWVTGTKVYWLLNQVIWKISDFSQPAIAEMIVRGEGGRLSARYAGIATVSASVAAWCAVGFAMCNSLFVSIWTGGKVLWRPEYDTALAVWMIISALVHCHNALIMTAKRILWMRWVFFVEGLVFVVIALHVTSRGGILSMILVSVACSTIFSGFYGLARVKHFLQVNWGEPLRVWLRPCGLVSVVFGLPALALWLSVSSLPDVVQFLVLVSVSCTLGLVILIRYGIPRELQHEAIRRSPHHIAALLSFAALRRT